MELEDFMKLLSKAKKDRYGNLYIENKEIDDSPLLKETRKSRWYFTLTNTVCNDLINAYAYMEKDGFEIYDRHSWNDDTLKIKIVREKNKNHD